MTTPLPEGKFGAILADPPWRFATFSEKGRQKCADQHYDVMSLEEIKALPVADVAADDCALFIWVLDHMIPDALEVIEAWGFTYKTVAFYWAKTAKGCDETGEFRFPIGQGYWTRANPEQCLLATKGRPQRLSRAVRRLVVSERREHSRKPDRIRQDVEALVGGPYLEMFSRSSAPGWTAWGNETEKFDEQE